LLTVDSHHLLLRINPAPTIYTFTIFAVSGGAKSNAAATSITVEEKAAGPKSPSNVQAKYDKGSNSIVISWNHGNDEMENVQYTVTYTVNGTTQTLTSTTELQAILSNLQPGQTYEFTVTASNQLGKSEPISTSITVDEMDNGEDGDGGSGIDSQ